MTELHLPFNPPLSLSSPFLIEFSPPLIYLPSQEETLTSLLLTPTFAYRRQKKEGKKQTLAKAMGLKPHYRPFILDATGGFGVDSCLLADLGCPVLILERHPLMAHLLKKTIPLLTPATQAPLYVLHTDSIHYLNHYAPTIHKPQVIYLDPMFPPSKKAAKNKKSLRLLKTLVGSDEDASELFKSACAIATKRVVVKRPRHAPFLSEIKPSHQLEGKSNRYDIYFTHLIP